MTKRERVYNAVDSVFADVTASLGYEGGATPASAGGSPARAGTAIVAVSSETELPIVNGRGFSTQFEVSIPIPASENEPTGNRSFYCQVVGATHDIVTPNVVDINENLVGLVQRVEISSTRMALNDAGQVFAVISLRVDWYDN